MHCKIYKTGYNTIIILEKSEKSAYVEGSNLTVSVFQIREGPHLIN